MADILVLNLLEDKELEFVAWPCGSCEATERGVSFFGELVCLVVDLEWKDGLSLCELLYKPHASSDT